jgi:hypothetical protein
MRPKPLADSKKQCPPWENERAVAQWAMAELDVLDNSPPEPHTPPPDKAHLLTPYRPTRDHRWAAWREQAFSRAKRGDFAVLRNYVAFAHLGDMSLFERQVLMDILAGKIKRKRGQPRKLHLFETEDEVNFERLLLYVSEARALLAHHYGSNRKGILSRAVEIAGEYTDWFDLPADETRERSLDRLRRSKLCNALART